MQAFRAKTIQFQDLEMNHKILQADFNEMQFMNEKQKAKIEKKDQQIKEQATKLRAFQNDYDLFLN